MRSAAQCAMLLPADAIELRGADQLHSCIAVAMFARIIDVDELRLQSVAARRKSPVQPCRTAISLAARITLGVSLARETYV